jgi:hypothetical protein
MKRDSKRGAGWVSLAVLLWLASMSLPAYTQSEGNNAVYSGTSSVTGSSAYIDATPWANTSTTICATLYNIMNSTSPAYPTPGAVIDARGLNSSNSNLTCAANTSPWTLSPGSTYLSKPARILLPAGKIVISYPWVVPDYTKIIGEGSSTSSGAAGATTIQAASNFNGGSGGPMIQLGGQVTVTGGSAGCSVCFEISMSDLTLDGQSQSIDGVDNSNAEELSTLQRVALLNIEGNGVLLSTNSSGASSGTASHSGPYQDLYISAGTSATSSTTCVKIYNAQPRGVHGLTCSAGSTTAPKAGIYLDGGNVSLENLTISGFTDGVLIGSETPLTNANGLQDIYADFLSNITGSTNMTNLVHICNPSSVNGNCSSTGFSGTEDIAMASLTGGSSINTIEDDLTGSTVTDTIVALYDLGEPVQANGSNVASSYSRFTTSPSTPVPTWLVGTAVNPTNSSCSTVANGTLYSRGISGGTGSTLWGCVSGKWIVIK